MHPGIMSVLASRFPTWLREIPGKEVSAMEYQICVDCPAVVDTMHDDFVVINKQETEPSEWLYVHLACYVKNQSGQKDE